MKNDFRFKEFSISQDDTAMKVGTDGVLLGAWVKLDPSLNAVLDIGTGTGLIALMTAQRSAAPIIDAIELEVNAYVQAVENFENSPWSDRLFCYHGSVQELAEDPEYQYDLIISNPPFFNTGSTEKGSARELARQTMTLSFEALIDCTVRLLAKTGCCAFIIPFDQEERFIDMAMKRGLHVNKLTRVRGTKASKIKRSLLQCSFKESTTENDEIIIEISRHVYTPEYRTLVKDFYLNM